MNSSSLQTPGKETYLNPCPTTQFSCAHAYIDVLILTEDFPVPQSEHAACPGLDLYLPATHPVQTPSVPVQPALQTQDLLSTLPVIESAFTHSRHSDLSSAEYEPAAQLTQLTADAFEYLPGSQAMHSADPGMAVCFPGTQDRQSLLFPDQPTLHEQKVILSLPKGECELWGHAMHTFLVLFEYEPAKQSVHVLCVEFKATENFPAAQSEHA